MRKKNGINQRLVSGILAPENIVSKLKNGRALYMFTSPAIERKNNKYKFVVDFRRLKSEKMNNNFMQNRSFMFRLKHELYVDLLSSIATHVNRGGVVYVE